MLVMFRFYMNTVIGFSF